MAKEIPAKAKFLLLVDFQSVIEILFHIAIKSNKKPFQNGRVLFQK